MRNWIVNSLERAGGQEFEGVVEVILGVISSSREFFDVMAEDFRRLAKSTANSGYFEYALTFAITACKALDCGEYGWYLSQHGLLDAVERLTAETVTQQLERLVAQINNELRRQLDLTDGDI